MLTPPDRDKIFALISCKQISHKVAAEQLGLSLRHVRRLMKHYKSHGSSVLINKKKGNVGRVGYSNDFKIQIIKLYKEKYSHLGPTAACKKLNEIDGHKISRESLRRWLILYKNK